MNSANHAVTRLFPTTSNQEAEQLNEQEMQQNGADYKDKDLYKLVTRKTENQDMGHISIENELRLMLLRHWSLKDSINNSNYVVSTLSLNKQEGKERYNELLAKLGIPLHEAS